MRRLLFVLVLIGMVAGSVGAQGESCALESRFEAGLAGRVLPGDANRIRAAADRNAEQTGTLPGGHYFRALEGVACSGGFLWREIEVSDGANVLQGWTVEGNATEYFVEPMAFHGAGISYEGVSFYVPDVMGDGASVEFVPADLSSDETRVSIPAYVEFAITGAYPDPFYDWEFDYPAIRIYRTDGYEDGFERGEDYVGNMFEGAFHRAINGVERLTGEQVDLSTFNVTDVRMPDLSPNSAHGTLAYRAYADFQNGTGYRFITYYQQAFYYPQDLTLLYRYLGLTELGTYLIVVEMPVSPPRLPEEYDQSLGANDSDGGFARYQTYVDGVDAFFNAIPPEEWLPNLDALDALVTSLIVTDVPELNADPMDQ